MLESSHIAVIGAGKMGGTLVGALVAGGSMPADRIVATTGHAASAEAAEARLGARVIADNAEAARGADLIILAVKPQRMADVLDDLQGVVTEEQVVVTIAAAIPTDFIEERLGRVPVIRAMPNTPCQVGQGMTVLCPGEHASAEHVAMARAVFSAVGRVAEVDNEALMDAVTGLSGSGPAYAYIIVESLAEGGVKVGLPRELATTLAAQALLGAAKMVLETGEHPAKLKDNVTTPAGTTVDGLMALEDGGLRVALIKAVEQATLKSKEIQI